MRKYLVIAAMFVSVATFAQKEQSLFNGKDLKGWTIYGTEKWYVDTNGDLVCESGPDKAYGYFATEKQYKDFELTLEFKQESNGNSGVFFSLLSRRNESYRMAGGGCAGGSQHWRYLRIIRS